MRNLTTYIEFSLSLLDDLKFDELEKLISTKSYKETRDFLTQLAYDPIKDEANLLVYTFLQSLLYKSETSQVHLLASNIMGITLNHISKAEHIGLFHGLRALDLDPENIDIMEYLLYFNHIPEKILSDEEAIELARKILLKRPDSKVALMTTSKTRL